MTLYQLLKYILLATKLEYFSNDCHYDYSEIHDYLYVYMYMSLERC